MDKQILNQLTELQKAVASIVATMATKDDLKGFATKDDLKRFATKDDLKKTLENHPTKADLKNALREQAEDICQVMTELFTETDKLKATKEEVALLTKRVTRLEQN